MADISIKLPKPKYGQIFVLQKNGDEPRGHGYPLLTTSCTVGRCLNSDIRISSGDVSDTHCTFLIDEASGEASLEIRGNETEVNETHFEPVSLLKLNHKDIVLVGGRKLRFEYLPPDFKPIPSKLVEQVTDVFNAEVVDMEENGDVVDSNAEKEEDVISEIPCTPSLKRVSFGPYLSPEQFDNTLPPATPVKKGATPRRSTRYSGLKFTRAPIDPLIEEENFIDTAVEEQVVTIEKECIDETMASEDAEASVSSVASVDETSVTNRTSPSLAAETEFPEISSRANLDVSSVDAMSTMSDVSNIAVVPSECCSFLDEPIEDRDFEVIDQEDTSLFADDLIGAELPMPEMTTPHLTNGNDLLRSFTTSLSENINEEEEEGITLSPEDMSEIKHSHSSIVESSNDREESIVESTTVSVSPQEDYPDVGEVKELPQSISATSKANNIADEVKLTAPDSSDVDGIEDLMTTVKPVASQVTDDLTKEGDSACEPMDQVEIVSSASVEKLIETPESSPSKSPEMADSLPVDSTILGEDESALEGVDRLLQTPKADISKLNCTDLEGVARLLETPKSTRSVIVAVTAVGKTPLADYTDVRGVKKLLQTPKPPPNTPKADYRDVRGVKRLLRTPKAAPHTPKADYTDVEGVDILMKTPKPPMIESDEEEMNEKSTCEAPIQVADSTEEIVVSKVQKDQPLTSEKDTKQEILPNQEPEETEKMKRETEHVEEERPVADSTPKRGRRAATAKANTPQADYRNVIGVKRLLRTPKPAPGTPKADYSDVEGVDLLMKTPKPNDTVPQIEEKVMDVAVVEAVNIAPETHLESETTQQPINNDVGEIVKEFTVASPEVNEVHPAVEEETNKEEPIEEERALPKRSRRAAAAKANTPKADYSDVRGIKRLLKTPKAAPGTPKADYTNVEGVDLLMKTPKRADPIAHLEKEEKGLVVNEEETPQKCLAEAVPESHPESTETAENPVSDVCENVEDVPASQIDEVQPVVEENSVEKESTPPKRARRAAAAKADTPKADYRDVRGVKRLLKTPTAAPTSPKADYTNVEGVDLLMKTPKGKNIEPESEAGEESSEQPEVVTQEIESVETTDEPTNEANSVAVSVAPEEHTLKVEVEVIPVRRSRRAAPTPKTNTPKPAGRSKRKQPQSEPEMKPEVNGTVEANVEEVPSAKTSPKVEMDVVDVPVKTVGTPRRGRTAAAVPASKVETPKASTRGKRQSESDTTQAEVEIRSLRPKRRKDDLLNDAKLSLSPVVRLHQIDSSLGSTSSYEVAKVDSKRESSSSNEEVASAEVKPVRRGRGRAKEVVVVLTESVEKKPPTRRGRAAVVPAPAVEDPILLADEVEPKTTKKKTRRAPSKKTVVAEKAEGAPEEKRRRGGRKPVTGLDDVEMLHEGKGHAADIHANHIPDDQSEGTNEEPVTTSSGRSTRSKKGNLKVHFEAAADSPVRSTRSTRKTTVSTSSALSPDKKLSVRLERDPDIDIMAADSTANEKEEKVSASTATKRPRQKKAVAVEVAETAEADESPVVPAVKRIRGGKKVSTESDVPKVENSSPPAVPSPRRTRRTRNI